MNERARTPTPTPTPTPERIFETMNAFQRSEALKAAIELDLFTAVAEGASTPAALAARLGASERGLRILCDYLAVLGFLTKTEGEYGLAPDAETYLSRLSPAYVGSAVRFLMAPDLKRAFTDVAGAVRKGGTTLDGEGSVGAHNPLWVEFARGMAPMVRPAAALIADVLLPPTPNGEALKVLDVAAGHGLFGIELARRHHGATVHAVDWPSVLEVARENAAAAGVSDRHHSVPGSAFDVDFGEGFDLVLLTNFLHHFEEFTIIDLLVKTRRSLAKGGRVATLEFVPNEDRISPPQPAAFSFVMLNTTPSGDAYTFAEYESMFERAGFARTEIHRAPGLPQSVLVSFTDGP